MSGDDDVIVLLGRLPLFLPLFALVLFRITGLMITAPVYGSQLIPIRLRVMLAVAIALVMFPVVAGRLPSDVTLGGAVAGVFGELAIGLIIGLGSGLMFAGVQLSGMVIGQQAGLSLGQVFNPVLDTDSTTLGEVFFMVALTVFVIVGGHRELMRALLDTYETIPVLSFRFNASWITLVSGLLTSAFTLALRLAGPVLISLLLATLVMGFLSRTMPQLNILSVGFVVRVLVALGAAGLALSAAEGALTGAIRESLETIRSALGMG